MTKTHKAFLSLLLFFCLSLRVQAQVQFGLRVGGNLSTINLNYKDGEDYQTDLTRQVKTGFNFAVLFNVPLNKSFSLQIEPGYAGLGKKYEFVDTYPSGHYYYYDGKTVGQTTVHLSYLNLPVLIQYRPKIGKVEGIISLGPEVRLLTRPMTIETSDADYENDYLESESEYSEAYGGEGAIRKFDYGVVAGLGLAVPVKKAKLFFEVRYHYGIANITFPDANAYKANNLFGSTNFGVLIPLSR